MKPLSRKPLSNTFAFATRCFVCDPGNAGGMRQQFYLDEDERRVVAEFTPSPDHSGAPKFAHGGASMAVVDDAMAWAVIALCERFGVTRHSEIDFRRPVLVGAAHQVRAWVESHEERALVARGEIRDGDGQLCVAARATYLALTLEEAMKAIGPSAQTASRYVGPAS